MKDKQEEAELKFEGNYYLEENKDGVKIIETLEWRSDDLMPEHRPGSATRGFIYIAFVLLAFVYFWPILRGYIGV